MWSLNIIESEADEDNVMALAGKLTKLIAINRFDCIASDS